MRINLSRALQHPKLRADTRISGSVNDNPVGLTLCTASSTEATAAESYNWGEEAITIGVEEA